MLLKINEAFRKRTQNELKTMIRLDPKIGAKRAILVEFASGNKPTRGVTGGYIDFRLNSEAERKPAAKYSTVSITDSMLDFHNTLQRHIVRHPASEPRA
jgi:hypothetical protein